MKNFKSVQDLIIKAALYDGVTTTISADDFIGGDVLKITFSRDNRHSVTSFDLVNKYRDPEERALYCCKRSLFKLLCGPYEEIVYPKETRDDESN